MRIVLLGDIHANLPALETALDVAKLAGYDRLLHTGDLIGYGSSPSEVVGRIIEQKIEGVRGDFDESAAWDGAFPGCFHPSHAAPDPETTGRAAAAALPFDARVFLQDLPFSLEWEAHGGRVSLSHASPVDLFLPVGEESSETELREIIEAFPAEVYLSGHTHRPLHRILDGHHFISAGSVGYPWDGDPRGCLAIVDLSHETSVEFRRFELPLT